MLSLPGPPAMAPAACVPTSVSLPIVPKTVAATATEAVARTATSAKVPISVLRIRRQPL